MARRRPANFLEPLLVDQIGRSPRPSTAHELTERLQQAGTRVFPNQVFLGLDRLLRRGAIRRVEVTKGYVAAEPGEGATIVCSRCGCAIWLPVAGVDAALSGSAIRHGFAPSRLIVEAVGLCRSCRLESEPAG